jgi:hypothetical protein
MSRCHGSGRRCAGPPKLDGRYPRVWSSWSIRPALSDMAPDRERIRESGGFGRRRASQIDPKPSLGRWWYICYRDAGSLAKS